MTIARKLVILFLIISLVPIAIISIITYYSTKDRITKQVLEQLQLIATEQESKINSILDQNQERIAAVTKNSQIQKLLNDHSSGKDISANIHSLLSDVKSSISSFNNIYILNSDGDIIGTTDNESTESALTRFAASTNKDNRHSEAFFKDEQNKLKILLSAPIKSSSNSSATVVAIDSNVENILGVIRNYSGLGESGETLLAKRDPHGNALYISPSRFNANSALTSIVIAKNRIDPMIQALSDNETVISGGWDYRGKRVLAATRYIQKADWGLVVKIDEDEAFAPIYQLRNYLLIIGYGTSFLVVLIAWFFARTITLPIVSLTSVASKLRDGDLTQRAFIDTKDEIGLLARAFNDMGNKLSTLYNSLEGKVKEKTAELADKVKETQQQVAKDEALLASIGDGVIATDRRERIILINSAAQEMLGFSPADVIGTHVGDLIIMEDSSHELVPKDKNPLAPVVHRGRKISTHASDGVCFIRKDKTRLPVAITATPVQLNDEVTGSILVFRDITVAREIDRMKTEFISLASHQLRTPLSAIKWFSGMLMSGDAGSLSSEQKELLENILQANERMIELVRSLLNISRIESGRIIIDPKPTHLDELVTEVVHELQARLIERKITCKTELPNDLPVLNIDPNLIREVYVNLLTNAIKYTPEGGTITISIYKNDDELISQVKDTGYGIPQNEHQKVFQKFYRGENILSKDTDGSGLGLYLVKAIIDSSGGDIWFDSKEGAGTVFWFSLPLVGSRAKKGEVSLDVRHTATSKVLSM